MKIMAWFIIERKIVGPSYIDLCAKIDIEPISPIWQRTIIKRINQIILIVSDFTMNRYVLFGKKKELRGWAL